MCFLLDFIVVLLHKGNQVNSDDRVKFTDERHATLV